MAIRKRDCSVAGPLSFTHGLHKGKKCMLVGRFSQGPLTFVYAARGTAVLFSVTAPRAQSGLQAVIDACGVAKITGEAR